MKKGYMKSVWLVECSCDDCEEYVLGHDTTAALRAILIRAGWSDTAAFGWRCPSCTLKVPRPAKAG